VWARYSPSVPSDLPAQSTSGDGGGGDIGVTPTQRLNAARALAAYDAMQAYF
jgi:hypothetical protein